MKKQLVLLRTNPRSFAKIIKNRIGTNGKSANLLILSGNAQKISLESLAHMEKMNNFVSRTARK